MRILVADKFPASGRERLAAAGFEVTFNPDVPAENLAGEIGDHELLLVRGKTVSGEALRAAKELQLVVRAGAGYNTIDVATASELGIYVANCPGKNAIAVAELALGLLIALDRRIPQARAELLAGKWNKKQYSVADGLFGKTLGIVGVGTIGMHVARRAQALGMRVVGWSRSLTAERAKELGIEWLPSLPELAKQSDAVSVHLAYAAQTKGIIGEEFLAALPERAMVINTSRGGVVDEEALVNAMEKRGIRYAADVFDGEPGGGVAEFAAPLVRNPDVVCTPHIGASTDQAQEAVADEAVRVLTTFKASGMVPNCVNLCAQTPARWQLNVRHLDKVGVLANVLGQLSHAGINVEELENVIFEGAHAACARIRLSVKPDTELLQGLSSSENVIHAELVAL